MRHNSTPTASATTTPAIRPHLIQGVRERFTVRAGRNGIGCSGAGGAAGTRSDAVAIVLYDPMQIAQYRLCGLAHQLTGGRAQTRVRICAIKIVTGTHLRSGVRIPSSAPDSPKARRTGPFFRTLGSANR